MENFDSRKNHLLTAVACEKMFLFYFGFLKGEKKNPKMFFGLGGLNLDLDRSLSFQAGLKTTKPAS